MYYSQDASFAKAFRIFHLQVPGGTTEELSILPSTFCNGSSAYTNPSK